MHHSYAFSNTLVSEYLHAFKVTLISKNLDNCFKLQRSPNMPEEELKGLWHKSSPEVGVGVLRN